MAGSRISPNKIHELQESCDAVPFVEKGERDVLLESINACANRRAESHESRLMQTIRIIEKDLDEYCSDIR